MIKRFHKLAHVIYECKYHVIFCHKCRYRILKDEVGSYVEQLIYQSCEQKAGYAHRVAILGTAFWSCGYRVSTVGTDEDQIRECF